MWAKRGQGGFTLLESIISIMFISTVLLSLAVGLMSSIRGSGLATEVQRVDSALTSFTESLKTAPYPTVVTGCPTVEAFRTSWNGYADRWSDPGVTTEILGVENWDPSTGDYETGCPGAAPGVNPQVQRLMVRVTIGDRDKLAQVVVSRA